jgi:hypothetical protein
METVYIRSSSSSTSCRVSKPTPLPRWGVAFALGARGFLCRPELRTRLPAMLIRAGAGKLARTLDERDIDAALPTIRGWAENLQTQARLER